MPHSPAAAQAAAMTEQTGITHDRMENDAALKPTPNRCALPRRFSDFATFGEALDYAAQGSRGLNFHDPRGRLVRAYPFSELREDALAMARRLVSRGVKPGERIALVAQTCPEFAALFCGAIYAGAWPVPLPLPTSFGGKESYIDQLSVPPKLVGRGSGSGQAPA